MRRLLLACGLILACGAAVAGPGDAAEWNNEGIAHYDAGEYPEAIACFEKAYEGAPDNTTVRRNLCNAHQAQADLLAKANNYAAAIENLNTAIAVDPGNQLPLIQIGSYYLRQNMVNDAIFRLEEAIELKPGVLDAHELLGEAYYRDNDLPSARAQWEYVLEMDPSRNGLQERYEKAFREESVEYDFNRVSSGSRHFSLTYPKEVAYRTRARVLTILERAYMDIGRKFGGVYPPSTVQVIVYDKEQFEQATLLNGHVGAVYDGKIRSPLTSDAGEWLSDDELKRRLTHEYVHVVVRHLAGDNVAWWLNEGLAETFSLGAPDAARAGLLQHAYDAGVEFSLAELEAHQLRRLEPESLRLAYAQSHATVYSLWSRFGQQKLIRLMTDIAAGVALEESLRANYRRTYATLEREIAAQYR